MTQPTINKPLEKWTWDDLLSWAAWRIAERLIAGSALRSIMHEVLHLATEWHRVNLKQQGELRKRSPGRAKGGNERAAKLSPEQRSEIARKGAEARWANRASP